jgi:acyl-homoserine-lactone acylase
MGRSRVWVTAAVLMLAATAAKADDLQRWRAEAARVSIIRDDWGIAHVHGHSDADAVFGMVYAQAEDDFHRVEANYLTALGRTAEAEGEGAIWQDLRQRLYVDPDDLKAKYAASPAWLKALMDAWADGLNYYLATHPDVHPAVLARFEPWMALSFTEGSIGGDIERIPLKGLETFYGGRAAAAGDTSDPARLAELDDARVYKEPTGSNGIAVAPSNTLDHNALLLINPHTSFFFRSELQMTSDAGLNVYGAATWGQFFIYQGFTPHIGFMHTSSGVDVVDEFLESIVRRNGALFYRYGGQMRPVTTATVTIAYRTASGAMTSRPFTVFRTSHGPIIGAEGVGRLGDKWLSFAMMYKPVAALSQSFLRTKAVDYASFVRVSDTYKANSSNNTVFADDKGDIAYLHPQFIPRRNDRFDYTRPVDGADPATDWQGDTPMVEAPHLLNPSSGFIYNSNDAPWNAAGLASLNPAAYPKYMDQAGWNPRGPHALRVLTGRKDFTLPALKAAAYDSYLPEFAILMPQLLADYDALPAGDPRNAALAQPIAALRAWDLRWGAASIPTTLAVSYGERLWSLSAPDARAAKVSPYAWMRTHLDAATRLAALDFAVDKLTADFGTWRTPWGAINRFQRLDDAIEQTFHDDRPSIPVPFTSSQWGSLASFGTQPNSGTKKRYGTSGNSFVAVVAFGPKVRAVAVTAGGESGDPRDTHFDDEAQRYASGALRTVYFWPDDLTGHDVRRYRPGE